ncbi:hypothetical protein K443DRAFT_684199 [Laccaria amethystina LaAM-08-1]|uniref:Uncharacterized protein n=1 Tax=Laccaria amethystina LaAM-08-1 TaxID=1095629 RepID=A0A0C9XC87_9AGAR|nr:hypothetical protein K443DRAFT_684199 [Laccaria amethystina LaAM-08-1]
MATLTSRCPPDTRCFVGREILITSLLLSNPPPPIDDLFDVNSYAWSSIEHYIWSRHRMGRIISFKIQLGRPTDIAPTCSSTSQRVPISTLSLMLFLGLVAFGAWPDDVVSL